MSTEFKDHFSEASEEYSDYRPSYPAALFEYLSSVTKSHDRAWDCATGTGQSAISLSNYYSEVIATDASETQIKKSVAKKGVTYKVALAEDTDIESNSIDLITVAQALHWFNINAFTREVNRVLNPDGVLAIWTYNLLNIRPEIDDVVNHFYGEVLDPYWPEERKIVEDGYKDINFPFQEKQPPSFQMETYWNLQQLIGYLGTWSAVKRYQKETGVDPVDNVQDKLAGIWGQPDNIFTVKWPLTVRLWVKTT